MSERTQYLIAQYLIAHHAATLKGIASELSGMIAQGERARYDQLSEAAQLSDEGRAMADAAATLEAVAGMVDQSAGALVELLN